jgi:hypothetical protein
MKWLTFKVQREPGFRFNLIDFLLIAAIIAASAGWHSVFPFQYLFLLPLYVGGSFFLFCNVFRIGNRMEIPWYVTFVAVTAYGFSQPDFPWVRVLSVCEGVKWTLIAYRIRRGTYVGAFRHQLAGFSAVPRTINN